MLIVEDDPDLSLAMAETFRDEGYDVCVAADGLEALSCLRSGARPHVIVLDMMMPNMDGEEFAVEQRKDPALAGIPIIVVTGAGNAREKAAAVAAADYLSKPFATELLLATVDQYC